MNLSVCTSRDLGGNAGEGVLLRKGLDQTDGMLPDRVPT